MKAVLLISVLSLIGVMACENTPSKNILIAETKNVKIQPETNLIDENGTTIETRFNSPQGYLREKVAHNSFAHYLRQLPLKPANSNVLYYHGEEKINNNVYSAVVDLKIGKKNLHQCADAIMRLRAEHFWNEKRYDKIHFNFTNGFRVDYTEWKAGKRMVVKGNRTYWQNSKSPSNTYADFWAYMELIFTYSGTLSLSKELKQVPIVNMKIGDVFIKGGSPGHAVIVVDMVTNKTTGNKLFLLAQSYMPAQELQILQNPSNSKTSWYNLSDTKAELYTPEWNFSSAQLKRFSE